MLHFYQLVLLAPTDCYAQTDGNVLYSSFVTGVDCNTQDSEPLSDETTDFVINSCSLSVHSQVPHPGYVPNTVIRYERGIRFASGEFHQIALVNGRTGSLRLENHQGITQTRVSPTFAANALIIIDRCARSSALNYINSQVGNPLFASPAQGWISEPVQLKHKGTYNRRAIRGSAASGSDEDERSMSLHTFGRAIDLHIFTIAGENFQYDRDVRPARFPDQQHSQEIMDKWTYFWLPLTSCLRGSGILSTVDHNDAHWDHLHVSMPLSPQEQEQIGLPCAAI